MKKTLNEIMGFGSNLITIITFLVPSAPIAIGVTFNSFAWGVGAFVIMLLIFIIIIMQKLVVFYGKYESLYALVKEQRIQTLNFILCLEAFPKTEEQKKMCKPYISDVEFHFFIRNNVTDKSMADVEYNHTFLLKRHDELFDVLLLHAVGQIEDKQTYCLYNNERVDRAEITHKQNVKSEYNQRVSPYYFKLPKQEQCPSSLKVLLSYFFSKVGINKLILKCDELKLHYYNREEYSLKNDEVFTIVPMNYGKCFLNSGKKNGVRFCLEYDKNQPHLSVCLEKLDYDRGKHEIIPVKPLYTGDDGKTYTCEIDFLDVHSIYFIIIKKQ